MGKQDGIPKFSFFVFNMGCPPLAYIMGVRYMGSGAKVMLAIGYGYGYSLFDFAIDYCHGYWLLLIAIHYSILLLTIVMAIGYC